MRGLTKCLKALANERRLKILLELTRREPLTINNLAKRIGLSIKSTSKHIQKMVDCELIERKQHSAFVWCRLNRKHGVLKSILSHLK